MFQRIVVPLDGSDLSERALAPALELARQSGSEVTLLRVPAMETMLAPDPVGLGGFAVLWPDQALDQCRKEAREYLRSIREARSEAGFTLKAEVIDGEVASTILDTASRMRADLIVMSTHGYSGIARWVMGSVTEKVLQDAPCPVWVLRTDELPRRILIPLDGSPLAEQALAPGLELAARLRAETLLMRVVPEIEPEKYRDLEEIEQGFGRRLAEEHVGEAGRYLAQLADADSPGGPQAQIVLRIGDPAECILDFAHAEGVDLIAMATHGRTGIRRWVYGSVTGKILRSGSRSMLIVRPER